MTFVDNRWMKGVNNVIMLHSCFVVERYGGSVGYTVPLTVNEQFD